MGCSLSAQPQSDQPPRMGMDAAAIDQPPSVAAQSGSKGTGTEQTEDT